MCYSNLGPPIMRPRIKVGIDPHDHTNYYAHSPGGHFGYGNFSPGVPQISVGLDLA